MVRRRLEGWAIIVLAVWTASVVTIPSIASPAASGGPRCDARRAPERDVRYRRVSGPGAELTRLDVYPAPSGCRNPVVVWVHGGAWRAGDKRLGQRDKRRLFRDLGYTYVSVNYRLTDPAAAEPLRFPVHEQDVAAAVAWVHDHIARYGGDPEAIALLGHSAGAQIVALLAADERYLARHGVDQDVVVCVAPLDTEGFDVSAAASSPGRLGATYQAAFGTDPAVWARASAIEHIEPDEQVPGTFLVLRGTPRRRMGVEAYERVLAEAGADVTTVDASGASHADVNRLLGVEGETVITPALAAFLDDCFASDRGG